MIIVFVFITLLFPTLSFAGPNSVYMGEIESGQAVSGTLGKNQYGLSIPEKYGFTLTSNSIIRIIADTQITNTVNINIESDDSPDKSDVEGNIANIRGNDLTTVNDVSNANPQTYGSSNFSLSADMRNTNPSTEVFGNLCAGTYYIRVDGSAPSSDAESLAKYSFKLYIEPLKYSNDTGEI